MSTPTSASLRGDRDRKRSPYGAGEMAQSIKCELKLKGLSLILRAHVTKPDGILCVVIPEPTRSVPKLCRSQHWFKSLIQMSVT